MSLPHVTPLVLAALFIMLFSIECIVPLRRPTRRLLGRAVVNLAMTALAIGTAAIAVQPAASATLQLSTQHHVGLLHTLTLPPVVHSCLAFLLLDLSFYYWHLANHRLPLLWRFHNTHHIDPDLDVTTAFRFHFGEVALSTVFRVAQITAIGVSPATFLLYELVFQANTLFHHSNVRLPLGLERWLNKILVTPRMHGIHHSQVYAEANSNYSVVFSWWDRLHRTLHLNVPQSRIVIGIAGYSGAQDNALHRVLALPFTRQRPYWETPSGQAAVRKAEDTAGSSVQMTE